MPAENLPSRVWNKKTKFTYYHWLAALVKGKCLRTKPICLATGVVCHPDTEQNSQTTCTKSPDPAGNWPGTYCTASKSSTSVSHYSTLHGNVLFTLVGYIFSIEFSVIVTCRIKWFVFSMNWNDLSTVIFTKQPLKNKSKAWFADQILLLHQCPGFKSDKSTWSACLYTVSY